MNKIHLPHVLYKSSYNTYMHTIMLSTAQMRQCESAYLATGISATAMLRQAGQALARQLHGAIAAQQSIIVCAGPGYNGADGLVMAEVLHQCGHRVTVWYWRKPDAWLNALHEQGIPCAPGFAAHALPPPAESGTIIVDALLGIGLNRPVAGDLAAAVQWINQRPPNVCCVAVDVPSGCDADTGAVHGVAVRADCTLSAGPCKQGLGFLPALLHAGFGVDAESLGEDRPGREVSRGEYRYCATWWSFTGAPVLERLGHPELAGLPGEVLRMDHGVRVLLTPDPLTLDESLRSAQRQLADVLGFTEAARKDRWTLGFWQKKV